MFLSYCTIYIFKDILGVNKILDVNFNNRLLKIHNNKLHFSYSSGSSTYSLDFCCINKNTC